ncbi:MAG: galactose oxidase [Pseudonocardiales bacterium]|jgi:galactose oxidase|nr:galactose oxidase [Pseudonocardiales bacterium]
MNGVLMRKSTSTRTRVLRTAVIATLVTIVLPQAMHRLDRSPSTVARPGTPVPGHRHDAMTAHEIVPAAATTPWAPTLSRDGWTVSGGDAGAARADDQASSVLDGNRATIWHSATTGTGTAGSLIIDMHRRQPVSALVYLPRQDGRLDGTVGRYEVDLSSDGIHWKQVNYGLWAYDHDAKTATFASTTTRFVRLLVVSTSGGTDPTAPAPSQVEDPTKTPTQTQIQTAPASAAEINLLGEPTATTSASVRTTGGQALTPNATSQTGAFGSWGPVIGFPLVPVAAALLPNNKLLTWSAYARDNWGGANGYTQTAILDLSTGAVSQRTVSNTDHDMFCPGIAVLSDGRVLVAGGSGLQKASLYDPATNAWTAAGDMSIKRWYPGMTTLSNGNAFTLGGSLGYNPAGSNPAEIWSPSTGWRTLTGIQSNVMLTADKTTRMRDDHGWFIATSNGKVLQAGPSKQMNWIDTSGSGSVTPAGNRGDSADAMNGNAVYYDINKILTVGGATDYQSSPATTRAYSLDITGGTVTTTRVGDLSYSRAFANSVVLPDGKVVVMGGQSTPVVFTDTNSRMVPELWDPATQKFTALARMTVPRNYHSVAVLLPDGRIFSGGGGLCGTCATNHPDGQIFTPPYLLNADGTPRARPSITMAPTAATPGSTISVTTDRAVQSFALVRTGEATHSVNNDQRRVPLTIASVTGNTSTLSIPSDRGVVLPGNYLLFAMDASGVPSVSKLINVA